MKWWYQLISRWADGLAKRVVWLLYAFPDEWVHQGNWLIYCGNEPVNSDSLRIWISSGPSFLHVSLERRIILEGNTILTNPNQALIWLTVSNWLKHRRIGAESRIRNEMETRRLEAMKKIEEYLLRPRHALPHFDDITTSILVIDSANEDATVSLPIPKELEPIPTHELM